MENILSETIKKGYDYITNKNQTPTLNIQILEPLSVIIKLATVSLYPIGTKIAVYNNKLRICRTSNKITKYRVREIKFLGLIKAVIRSASRFSRIIRLKIMKPRYNIVSPIQYRI